MTDDPAELVVGVDMATAEVRAVAADAGGRVHGQASAPLDPPAVPEPGLSEQDAATWWPAVVDALAQLTDGLGRAAAAKVVADK